MRSSRSFCVSGSLFIFAAALTACGGDGGTPPSEGLAPVQSARTENNADLLYAVSAGFPVNSSSFIYIYNYPKGRLIKTLPDSHPYGECVDKNGDIFITQVGPSDAILEFAHGASVPKKTLLGKKHYEPLGCAINPTDGDLAVANTPSSTGTGAPATVSIYKHASGRPTVYVDSNLTSFDFCGYDDKGNLFVSAATPINHEYTAFIAELPKGKTSFKNFNVSQWLLYPGGVQWDGKYMAIGNGDHTIYRFSFNNGQIKEIGKTSLADVEQVFQFVLVGGDVIGGNVDNSSESAIDLWKYPAGGNPIRTLAAVKNVTAVAISPGK